MPCLPRGMSYDQGLFLKGQRPFPERIKASPKKVFEYH